MVFNSISFFVFFVIVFCLYYFVLNRNVKWQNGLLLVSSYFFYGYADWRMLPLILASTLVFYGLGIWIEKSSERKASILTTIGVTLGIGVLLYFKYLNFFVESFSLLFESLGFHTNHLSFNIIMPVGISFFTFKLISYIVEIHRGKLEASRNIVDFATYISFFPCILSGPIDRPGKFLPQLQTVRILDANMLTRGCQQILWGLFKKMVIADNLMGVIDRVWDISTLSGSTYIFAALLYPIQMYADFSGYSDMAIGVGKVLGIKIAENFKYPFFSRNIAEYWKKWHMSLTSWLTDYVFMPLNIKLRQLNKFGLALAIIINMMIIGFWHGANWTFCLFGLFHGLLYVPLIVNGSFYKKDKIKTGIFGLPSIKDFASMMLTFIFVSVGLVIFKANSVSEAFHYFTLIAQPSIINMPRFIGVDNSTFLVTLVFIVGLAVADWRNRNKECPLFFENSHCVKAILCYAILVSSIYFVGGDSSSFIYFKF